jgi:hypothetical protein
MKISEQWPEFYDRLKKANKSNMMNFSSSLDLVDKYNEALFDYLTLQKIPIIYVNTEKIKNSAIFKKYGSIPNAIFWCAYLKYNNVERINIFVNTEGTTLKNIAMMAMKSEQDLFPMLETILAHESIHAYLYSLNFHVNYDAMGRAMSMLHLITDKSNITKNEYVKNRLKVINNSDPQEIITYILTETVLSDFVKTIVIDGKNGWLAYCDFINYIDPYGILLKYAQKRQEVPEKILSEAEIKYRLFKHKGDYYERPTTVKLEDGGIIEDHGQEGGLIEGKSHSKGGVKAIVKPTGKDVELEAGEAVIKKTVVKSKKKYEFEGKEKTPREILNKLNVDGGGNMI